MEILFFLVFIIVSSFCFFWFFSTPILLPESSLAKSKEIIQTDWGTSYEEIITQLPKSTDFSITSFDGVTISGKYFKSNITAKCVIIGAHGWTGTWIDMLKYIPILKDSSCDLILYDHRAHGASDRAYATGGINEAKDLLKITEWARNTTGLKNEKIGWIGSSWGGATALIAGATKINIGFIIADAPFQNWYSAIFERAERDYGTWTKYLANLIMMFVDWRTGVNHKDASPLLAVKNIEVPVLLIHSKTDEATDAQQSINISKNLNPQSTFHLLDWGGAHTLDVVTNKDRFQTIVHDFLIKVDGPFLK